MGTVSFIIKFCGRTIDDEYEIIIAITVQI